MRHAWLSLLLLALLPSSGQADALEQLSHRDKLYDVTAFGGTLFAVGHPGIVLTSTDGGQTYSWLEVAHEREALFSIAFNRKGRGAIVGRSGAAFVSDDAGKSWQKREVLLDQEKPNLFSVAVLDDGAIVAVGEFGVIVRSTDLGQSWTRESYATELPDAPEGESAASSCPTLEEAGNENADFVDEARLTDIASDPEGQRLFVVGEFGLILRSDDGGETFSRQRSCTDKLLFSVAAPSGEHVLVVGSEGTVLESRDGGAHWTSQASGTKEHLFGVWADARRCLVLGAQGTLLRREGQGAFEPVATDIHTWLSSAYLYAAGHGVLVGSRAHVLVTEDGGKTLKRLRGD